MGQITRQQLCADFGISESTVRRLEQDRLPFTPVGKWTKRYDLAECKTWLHDVYRSGEQPQGRHQVELSEGAKQFMETARKMKRRVEPS